MSLKFYGRSTPASMSKLQSTKGRKKRKKRNNLIISPLPMKAVVDVLQDESFDLRVNYPNRNNTFDNLLNGTMYNNRKALNTNPASNTRPRFLNSSNSFVEMNEKVSINLPSRDNSAVGAFMESQFDVSVCLRGETLSIRLQDEVDKLSLSKVTVRKLAKKRAIEKCLDAVVEKRETCSKHVTSTPVVNRQICESDIRDESIIVQSGKSNTINPLYDSFTTVSNRINLAQQNDSNCFDVGRDELSIISRVAMHGSTDAGGSFWSTTRVEDSIKTSQIVPTKNNVSRMGLFIEEETSCDSIHICPTPQTGSIRKSSWITTRKRSNENNLASELIPKLNTDIDKRKSSIRISSLLKLFQRKSHKRQTLQKSTFCDPSGDLFPSDSSANSEENMDGEFNMRGTSTIATNDRISQSCNALYSPNKYAEYLESEFNESLSGSSTNSIEVNSENGTTNSSAIVVLDSTSDDVTAETTSCSERGDMKCESLCYSNTSKLSELHGSDNHSSQSTESIVLGTSINTTKNKSIGQFRNSIPNTDTDVIEINTSVSGPSTKSVEFNSHSDTTKSSAMIVINSTSEDVDIAENVKAVSKPVKRKLSRKLTNKCETETDKSQSRNSILNTYAEVFEIELITPVSDPCTKFVEVNSNRHTTKSNALKDIDSTSEDTEISENIKVVSKPAKRKLSRKLTMIMDESETDTDEISNTNLLSGEEKDSEVSTKPLRNSFVNSRRTSARSSARPRNFPERSDKLSACEKSEQFLMPHLTSTANRMNVAGKKFRRSILQNSEFLHETNNKLEQTIARHARRSLMKIVSVNLIATGAAGARSSRPDALQTPWSRRRSSVDVTTSKTSGVLQQDDDECVDTVDAPATPHRRQRESNACNNSTVVVTPLPAATNQQKSPSIFAEVLHNCTVQLLEQSLRKLPALPSRFGNQSCVVDVDQSCRSVLELSSATATSPGLLDADLLSEPVFVAQIGSRAARDLVLRKCKQREPLAWSAAYSESLLNTCWKIGEGVYGEVFILGGAGQKRSVMKVIPIEGEFAVNGEPQKKFEEIISEIIITMELSNLRQHTEHPSSAFAELLGVRCIRGRYPAQLLDKWQLFNETRESENDNPEVFDDDQLYIVLELGHGGQDLESYRFESAVQSYALFKQLCWALSAAEAALQFEHRDLHWGNVLIRSCDYSEQIGVRTENGREVVLDSGGVQLCIIDYTLSRLTVDGACIFYDFALDPELFDGKGDYQFDIYRKMKTATGDDWQKFTPRTNILWLDYVLHKMTTQAKYLDDRHADHKAAIRVMRRMRRQLVRYDRIQEFIMHELMD